MPLSFHITHKVHKQFPPETLLKALSNNDRSLYIDSYDGQKMNHKLAELILKSDHAETYGKPLMMMYPSQVPNQVFLDTISSNGTIESLLLEYEVIENELHLNGMNAHEYLNKFSRIYESVFLLPAIQKEMVAIKHREVNPRLDKIAKNLPYVDIMKIMCKTIENDTSFRNVSSEGEAERVLSKIDLIGCYLTWKKNGHNLDSEEEMPSYILSIKTLEQIEHIAFSVDAEGNILDEKQNITFTHFSKKHRREKGDVFVTSLFPASTPIGKIKHRSQSSKAYSAQRSPL